MTVCLFTIGVCVSQLQAAPLNPAEIPGDTKWLLHFDAEKARDWKLIQKWKKQMASKAWYRDKVSEMAESCYFKAPWDFKFFKDIPRIFGSTYSPEDD